MKTIYLIRGGGQYVRQFVQKFPRKAVEYEKVNDSDYPEKSGVCGQDFYANSLWNTNLDTLRTWANEWVGREVRLVEKKKK